MRANMATGRDAPRVLTDLRDEKTNRLSDPENLKRKNKSRVTAPQKKTTPIKRSATKIRSEFAVSNIFLPQSRETCTNELRHE